MRGGCGGDDRWQGDGSQLYVFGEDGMEGYILRLSVRVVVPRAVTVGVNKSRAARLAQSNLIVEFLRGTGVGNRPAVRRFWFVSRPLLELGFLGWPTAPCFRLSGDFGYCIPIEID